LHTFTGGSDGGYPNGLVVGANGALYGTTSTTVFELAPPAINGGNWSFTVLHQFTSGTDGYNAEGPPLFGFGGALYGTTQYGGTFGGGTVFELAPPPVGGAGWTETIIHNFPFGYGPVGNLALGANGALAGVTFGGGFLCDGIAQKCGMAYSLQPPPVQGGDWILHVLHKFTAIGNDGGVPEGGVIVSGKGLIYGTTSQGGTGTNVCEASFVPGCGTVFELTP